MKRKFLDRANIPNESRPDKWYSNTGQDKKWKRQRKKYGFDERDTYSMDTTFYCWLLERLMMYKEISYVDLDGFPIKYEESMGKTQISYNDQELTLGECIDRMIEGCCIALTDSDYGFDSELKAKVDDVVKIWAVTIHDIWW